MAEYVLRMFKHVLINSFPISSMKFITIQQMMINSFIHTNQLGPLMARPFELIDMTNVENQMEMKLDG